MSTQSTNTLLMVRPVGFRMNEQTAVNNYYQQVLDGMDAEEVQENAANEFDDFVDKLREVGIRVIVIEDTPDPDTPDSIFPNNWISFHSDGRVALYPMYAENRRNERRDDVILIIQSEGMDVSEILDFTEFEEHGKFLEGTGSLVLDRMNKIAYAALSERTDMKALEHFCVEFDYEGVPFQAMQTADGERLPIYHTNVMMCIADELAIICADCIDDLEEREMVLESLRATGHEILEITEDQTQSFAGNMLQVNNQEGTPFLIMSNSAHSALTPGQVEQIESKYTILHSSLDTIEACGGGSARCMMAEVFLPKSNSNE